MVEKLGNAKTARKYLKVRETECEYCANRYCIKCFKFKPGEYEVMGKPGCMWVCLKCQKKFFFNILNETVIEKRCEMYSKIMNTGYDSKEVKEIVSQEMDAMHACRPNDDENRNLQTTQNSGNVVEETVKEISERKIGKQISLYPEPKTNLKE